MIWHSALADPALPFLTEAVDPHAMLLRLARALSEAGVGRVLEVLDVRLVRHRPGVRCLIEYDIALKRSDGEHELTTLIGKARATSVDRRTYALMRAFREAGLTESGAGDVCIAEPLGIIPELHMWLQRKVAGESALDLLDSADAEFAERVVRAIDRVHHVTMPIRRTHTLADELDILQERYGRLGQQRPELRPRLERLLEGCVRLAVSMGEGEPRGIHRDFYPEHVLVNGACTYIIDFDLYRAGDPALDLGNYIAHITECGLRTRADADAFAHHEAALENAYAARAGEAAARRARGFALLTLARHISLSAQLPNQEVLTEQLCELCEQRLGQTRRFPIEHARSA